MQSGGIRGVDGRREMSWAHRLWAKAGDGGQGSCASHPSVVVPLVQWVGTHSEEARGAYSLFPFFQKCETLQLGADWSGGIVQAGGAAPGAGDLHGPRCQGRAACSGSRDSQESPCGLRHVWKADGGRAPPGRDTACVCRVGSCPPPRPGAPATRCSCSSAHWAGGVMCSWCLGCCNL